MTRTTTTLLAVPALLLALSGCGSSGSDAGSATASTSSTMPSMSSSGPATSSATSSATSDAAGATIAIADFGYTVPATVAPGAKVTVTNADSQAHTVTSKKSGAFDVKVDGKGTASFTAPTEPGSYPFICTFHSNMSGTLVVK